MPLGFERLNERRQRPNALINFIKPLETADKATAEDFLQRIAAQCYPVMKKNHISVMSLEEYEPNPEFLGRNFNAGEVIQLVLKDKQGRWLSLKFVQMVMMHELAHCKQMNHSRFFWNVRNEYAKQMEGLWQEGYRGEGMWGRGRGLDGAFAHGNAPDTSQIPEHLCGGSYRRRGRKRKRGQKDNGTAEKLSYAERQQRRIARKFGVHGDGATVGEDELLRGALETMNGGKRGQGKPKVANSKRGRELRASAALARFEAAKRQPPDVKIKVEEDSETESEWEQDDSGKETIIKDEQGHDLVKVCGDEREGDDEGAGQEVNELRMLGSQKPHNMDSSITHSKAKHNEASDPRNEDREDSETASESEESTNQADTDFQEDNPLRTPQQPASEPTIKTPSPMISSLSSCPICSLENSPTSPTCTACSHVLHPNLMPDHWRCGSETCKATGFINAGDAGRCGLCGGAKPKSTTTTDVGRAKKAGKEKATNGGVTSAEVLRWD